MKPKYSFLHLEPVTGFSELQDVERHNRRLISVPEADPARRHLNRSFGDPGKSYKKTIKEILHDCGVICGDHRVVAFEALFAFSPGGEIGLDVAKWCEDSLNWAKNTFGSWLFVGAELHMDEKTPHCHAVFVPLLVRWVKKRGRRRAGQMTADSELLYDLSWNFFARNSEKKKEASGRWVNPQFQFWQRSYCEAMQAHGLTPSEPGSDRQQVPMKRLRRDRLKAKEEGRVKELIEKLEDEIKLLRGPGVNRLPRKRSKPPLHFVDWEAYDRARALALQKMCRNLDDARGLLR